MYTTQSVDWGYRIYQVHLSKFPPTTSAIQMTQTNLVMTLESRCFEECGILLHCHCSLVHFGLEL